MKVKIIRPTIALKRQVYSGDVLEVSKEEAIQLIGANKAVAVKDVAVETTSQPLKEVESSAQTEEPADDMPAPKRTKSKKASD